MVRFAEKASFITSYRRRCKVQLHLSMCMTCYMTRHFVELDTCLNFKLNLMNMMCECMTVSCCFYDCARL